MKHFFLKVLLLCLFAQIGQAQTSRFFFITDGKTNDAILSNSDIKVEQQLDQSTNPQIWKTTITNTSKEQRWLNLNWTVNWNGSANINDLHYWNGNKTPVSGEELLSAPIANANLCTSMIQTIYDDKSGLALALPPLEIVPVFQQSLEKTDTGFQLHLQIPLVLDAGESDTFPIEIYQFTPRYGFLDALQKYFSAHPDAFTARANIDQRAAGVGAAYTAWNGNSFERTRRFGGDWDWCYAPFKRTGDIYGRPQFWDYQSARPIPPADAKLTPEEYRAKRLDKFKNGDAAGAAMLFYVPAFIYAEENLAKENYPGAIVYKTDGKYAVYFDRPWVTGHDNEVMIYPWANKFSQQSQQDARDVAKENPISGFAYDVLNGGYPFRGTGMKESPRRAFNADGEYVDLSVGVAKMMDFTRNLEKDGRKMALVGNPTGNTRAFLVARCDSAMYERPPYKALNELIPLRYAMGHKPLTWWDDWGIASMIDWKNMTPDEIKSAYLGVADYVRLSSYRYGGYPSPRLVEGVPSIAHELPLLKEVVTSGWQAVPAARAASGNLPDFIWPARYGTGLGSFITLGNASRENWSGQIVIDDDYLGADNYLFVNEDGTSLSQNMNGRTTVINVQIPSHQTLVLRAVSEVSRFAQGSAIVSWKDDGANGQLSIESTFTPGKPIAPRAGWNEISVSGKTGNFDSAYFDSPVAEIQNFPFFGGVKNALIVLPTDPSPEETWAAEHIQQYFQFWGKNGIKPAQDITLQIISGLAPRDADQPLIYVSDSLRKIHTKGMVLQVGKSENVSLKDATIQLLDTLDQKYFYNGAFPRGGEEAGESDMIEKAGLAGKLLE
jgi:hypothetical protein